MKDYRQTGGGIVVERASYRQWLARHGLTEGFSLVGEVKIFAGRQHIATTFRWLADGGDDVHICPLPLRLGAITNELRAITGE